MSPSTTFAPDDETWEREMEQKYRSIKKSPKRKHECRRIDLPDIEGDRAMRDFIFSAKTLAV